MADPSENKEYNKEDEEENEEENDEENEENNFKKEFMKSFQISFQKNFIIQTIVQDKLMNLNEKKDIDMEIKGSKDEPKGISFEIINFDKSKITQFYDPRVEYIKKAEFVFSLNLELKEEGDFSTIKVIFDFFKSFINQIIPIPKFLETLFRKKGKQISFDIFKKKENNEIINDDSTGNNYINIGVKTGIDLNKIFSDNQDHFKNLIDAISAIIKFKIKGMPANYISLYILEMIKSLKIESGTLGPMFEKIYQIVDAIISSFLNVELKFEYDAMELANNIAKEICYIFGNNEEGGFQKIAQNYIDIAKDEIKIFKDELQVDNILDLIKNINLDKFSLSMAICIFNSGLALCFEIPGLNDIITNL